MASGYALPSATAGGSHHGHSHSFSSIHLSPGKKLANTFQTSNGSPRKAASNNALYTHAETSRETSPMQTPRDEVPPALEHNIAAVAHNHHVHDHVHEHAPSRSWSPMKTRPRGNSDLGNADYRARGDTATSTPAVLSSWLSLPEALTSLLVPLPYILASATFSSMSGRTAIDFPPLAVYERVASSPGAEIAVSATSTGILETCLLTSGTLLAAGIAAKVSSAGRMLDRRKETSTFADALSGMISQSAVQSMALRIASTGLPFYAAMQLGGARVGLMLLIALAVGLANPGTPMMPSMKSLRDVWSTQVATGAVMVLCFICDEAGLTIDNSLAGVILGYLALATSMLVSPPPFSSAVGARSLTPGSAAHNRSYSSSSILTRSVGDVNVTLAAGAGLAVFTGVALFATRAFISLSASSLAFGACTIASMVLAISLAVPTSLDSQSKAGLALGCLSTASCSFLFSPSLWPGTVCNGGLSALAFLSVLYDTNSDQAHKHHHEHHDREHTHRVHTDHHQHEHKEETYSALTKHIMARCEPGSLVYSILSEKDSRRIAYFTILNFGFMLVQGAYGYISGSLGLLSDTVHMFFDCLGLVVGLGAAVASKWPTSPEKPYGWGKLNTLAGFGNGVFLMLVSVEFVWEAIEGIMDKRELRHVQELLVVSTLGLLVNMVGLFAFGHAHAGHDHGHSHSHAPAPSHHDEHHDHGHGHSHGHAHSHDGDHEHKHESHKHEAHADHGHGHDHHNDNMHGIFLHVAADAGGSLAVIISTAMTLWKPWYGWDPLATIIIAVLIFAAAVPLVISSGQKLLLVVPESLEYSIKNTLQGLGELRGVIGYAAPRFWLDDRDDSADAHGHDHGHSAPSGKQKVQGVIHIIAAPSADLEEVRLRVQEFTGERSMDLVIHVEREADSQCWCGGVSPRSG